MSDSPFIIDVTRENFERLVPLHRKRSEPPFLVACTLLVPGYVTEKEVAKKGATAKKKKEDKGKGASTGKKS